MVDGWGGRKKKGGLTFFPENSPVNFVLGFLESTPSDLESNQKFRQTNSKD
jgi:hypothetical protein